MPPLVSEEQYRLIAEHTPLARYLARKFRIYGLPPADTEQEALYALCRAVSLYDPSRGRLSSWISALVWQHLRAVSKGQELYDWHILFRLEDLLRFTSSDGSCYEIPRHRQLYANEEDEPECCYFSLVTRADVRAALQQLTPQERRVVWRHYGFDGEEQSLRQIALSLGISPQRCTQLHQAALRRLFVLLSA